MSTVIVGNGISGLVCAVYLKTSCPDHNVVVIDHPGSSNSKLSGQRYRTRIAGLTDTSSFCSTEFFPGADVQRLQEFFSLGAQVIHDLTSGKVVLVDGSSLLVHDRPEWFGPQLGRTTAEGRGMGASVLAWLRSAATAAGVRFIRGEVTQVTVGPQRRIESGLCMCDDGNAYSIFAEQWVVASGCPSGSLFHSTNAENRSTLMVDLVTAGFPVRDAATYMLHMAGICDADGQSKRGCHETDLLQDHEVFLQDVTGAFTIRSDHITTLLRQHRAHYHFKAICREIIAHGGVAMYARDGKAKYGRVMHHYSHIGLDTIDGVSIGRGSNVLAIGDACGIGHWLGSSERLPGTALIHCLATARKAAEILARGTGAASTVDLEPCRNLAATLAYRQPDDLNLKDLNTSGLYAFVLGELDACRRWRDDVDELCARPEHKSDRLLILSRLIAQSCTARLHSAPGPVR